MTRFIMQSIKFHSMKAFRLVALSACVCLFAFSSANAQFAPDPCDSDYYESLEARAWLEAQREITQNQNLIFKPDSVLEYTCFDSFLRELVDHAGLPAATNNLFTGTNRWGSPPTDMRTALSDLVGDAIDEYDTSNFNHNYLGGRVTAWPSGGAPSSPSSATSYNILSSITAGNYACDIMDSVWMVAKCMNFVDNAAEDGFFTFAEYVADPDKRFLPTRCATPPGPNAYQTAINTALLEPTTPWTEDSVSTYFNLIYPTSGPVCGGAGSEIETGLIVERGFGGVTSYEEHICVVPGCHWVPSGGTAPSPNGSCQR